MVQINLEGCFGRKHSVVGEDWKNVSQNAKSSFQAEYKPGFYIEEAGCVMGPDITLTTLVRFPPERQNQENIHDD